MFETTAHLKHDKHHALYDALQESIQVDELQARFGSEKTSIKKRSHDDHDPPKNREGEKSMKRQKGTGGSSSKKGKAKEDTSNYERVEDAKEPRQEKEQEHKLVEAEEEPEEHELQNGSVVMFDKCMKKFLNKDKFTKEDLEGPAFGLLKNRFKNIVELEYNIEQCHLALIEKIDWANPEGNRFHDDLSKPLSLVGPPGRKTIPTSYFFNQDLEYLEYGNEEKKYALSVTKIKAARY
ncbi:hypothetical protein Tco_0857335 [Tanacetum coccineum]|uniref:Uncharacterized protein n=1 Tax=Tanacetum coccineum TaxID=301880 RepID=A0ABQ5B9X0_9ASTR